MYGYLEGLLLNKIYRVHAKMHLRFTLRRNQCKSSQFFNVCERSEHSLKTASFRFARFFHDSFSSYFFLVCNLKIFKDDDRRPFSSSQVVINCEKSVVDSSNVLLLLQEPRRSWRCASFLFLQKSISWHHIKSTASEHNGRRRF